MKKLNYFFALLTILSFSFIVACSNDESETNDEADSTIVQMEEKMNEIESNEADTSSTSKTGESTKLGKEYTAKYVCPMHCKGSGSDKPGVCSNSDCGMELIENPTYEGN